MQTEEIIYHYEGVAFKCFAAWQKEGPAHRPGVLVAHAWRGQDNFARKKAEALAELGYIGFAVDMFGNGQTASNNEEAGKLMMPLFLNRKLLRGRISAAYEALANHKLVNRKSIGAIGFCFGGLTVLELSRSGLDLSGVVSFHGVLGDKLGGEKAKLEPPAQHRSGAVLILHGYKDPLVSQKDITDMQAELSHAGLDWQMHIYGEASHAFTNPEAHEAESGLLYNAKADQRSWLSMKNFFKEILT